MHFIFKTYKLFSLDWPLQTAIISFSSLYEVECDETMFTFSILIKFFKKCSTFWIQTTAITKVSKKMYSEARSYNNVKTSFVYERHKVCVYMNCNEVKFNKDYFFVFSFPLNMKSRPHNVLPRDRLPFYNCYWTSLVCLHSMSLCQKNVDAIKFQNQNVHSVGCEFKQTTIMKIVLRFPSSTKRLPKNPRKHFIIH